MLHCTNSGFYQTRTHKNDHKLPSSSTLTNNNIFLSNRITGLTSSHAGVYQKSLVGFGNFLIRTLVPTTISATPYCKALIVNLFFYQIIVLADTSSLSFSDLMTTVASYVFPEHECHWEGGRRKPLLKLFVSTSFLFPICGVLNLQTVLGNLS